MTPRYDAGGLAGVLPAVLDSLLDGAGTDTRDERDALLTGPPHVDAPDDGGPGAGVLDVVRPSRRAVVVLVDGLGDDLLRQRRGHAPFLRGLLPSAARLSAGFPSTTATSMGSFGTGLPPGAHGLVGYQVLVPERDVLLNELSFDVDVDPRRWQPHETVFERAVHAGLAVTRIGPGFFDGSGLTNAALRGGGFAPAQSLDARVAAALVALRASRRALVYLYWGELDKVGHVQGCRSLQWGDELESIDSALAGLSQMMPPDTALYITGDHGMVDISPDRRIDLAHDLELAQGVRHVGGEPRAPQLYCQPGATQDVLDAWRGRLGAAALVCSRDEAVAAGWFGPVQSQVLPRIGDVVVAMVDELAVVDSRTARPEYLALLGMHGSLTSAEVAVPLLAVPAPHS